MTALMPTAYERGDKDPADHIAPPRKPKGYVLDKGERARRAELVNEAIALLGSAAAVARWLDTSDSQVSGWSRRTKAVPARHLDALEAILTRDDLPDTQAAKRTTGGDPLRHDGMAWCPECANRVPASRMHAFDGKSWVPMRHCKDCQSSSRIANDRAQAAANHGRTTSA